MAIVLRIQQGELHTLVSPFNQPYRRKGGPLPHIPLTFDVLKLIDVDNQSSVGMFKQEGESKAPRLMYALLVQRFNFHHSTASF